MTHSEQTDIAIIYLHELTCGATLLGMRVRLSTLKGYMNVMAKWVETHVGRDIRYHPTQALPNAPIEQWEHHPMLDNIYADTKAWEGMANRQDPVTKSMINYLRTLVVGKNPHCLTCALIDFAVLAVQTAWRGIEWVQPKNPRIKGKVKLEFYEYDNATSKFDNTIYACCVEDFTLKRKCGRVIQDPLSVPISEIAVCTIRWRFQKNLQHGQEIDFQASPADPEWCFVRAAVRIIERFHLFCGRPNTPVALYQRNQNSQACDWLTKRSVESKLKLAAWKVFYPDGPLKDSLAKITCHSFRIQAAVALFTAKATESVIMGRLRYLSNCYSMYYRNTPMLAQLHAAAVEQQSGSDLFVLERGVADDDAEG